jgi:hypothetical protein
MQTYVSGTYTLIRSYKPELALDKLEGIINDLDFWLN